MCVCYVDTSLSLDSDSVTDNAVLTVTLTADSVSVASVDSSHHCQLPYHMMLDDNTSVDHACYSDTEGLLRG